MGNGVTLSQTTLNAIGDVMGTKSGNVKTQVKANISDLLANGKISKEEAKAALKYADSELCSALASKNRVDFEDINFKKEDVQILNETGLRVEDLYHISELAGPDRTVNVVKLSKEEKALAKQGFETPSELANITNAINAKIKANGGTRVLSEKEALSLMAGIGLNTKNLRWTRFIPGLNGLMAAIDALTGSQMVIKNIKEKPFGPQDSSVSITNEVEQKMKEIEAANVLNNAPEM